MLRIDPLNPALDGRQPRSGERQRPVPHPGRQPVPGRGPGARDLRLRLSQPVPLRLRPHERRPDPRRRRPEQHRGDQPRHDRRQLRLGGQGRRLSCSTAPTGTHRRTVGDRSPGRPRRTDRSDRRHAGHAGVRPRRRHLDHRRLRLPRHARFRSCSASTSSATWRSRNAGRRASTAGCSTPIW